MRDSHGPGERLIRLLLRFFPPEFRARYGEDMVASYREECLERGHASASALFRLSLSMVAAAVRVRIDARKSAAGRNEDHAPDSAWGGTMGRSQASWLESLRGNPVSMALRLALRRIRRSPGYALAFILTLGLGIGINTAIFSVVNGVLLAPLPYADAERLVYLRQPAVGAGFNDVSFSFVEIADLKQGARSIDAYVEYGDLTFNVVGDGEPHRAVGGLVTSNYFEVLGLRSRHGRTLQPQDDGTGVEPVMVLTHGYWSRVFGGDPGVLGSTLKLYVFGQPRTVRIVGVLEPGSLYTGTRRQDFFVNYASSEHYGGAAMLDERTHRMTNVFGRLAPGQTVEQAQAELAAAHQRMSAQFSESYPERLDLSISVGSWREELTSEARPMLLILAGTVALVLLLACANVANLTLTRLIRRERELSVQAALGAGTGRMRIELLLENVLLSLAGAGLGLGLAVLGSDLLTRYAARFTVRTGEIGIDLTVLLVTGLVAVTAAIVLAWMPPLPGLHGLHSSAAAATGRRVVGMNRKHLQRALVVGQLALCFTLLVGAALLVRSLVNLSNVDAGLDYESVIAVDVPSVTGMPVEQNRVILEQIMERTRGFAGVREVANVSHVPFTATNLVRVAFQVEGRGDDEIPSPGATQKSVSHSYFETVHIPLLQGRAFQSSDGANAEPVVILNTALARLLFDAESPIDRRIRNQQFNGQWGPWLRVVGVAADTREFGLARDATHAIYRPTDQAGPGQSLVIRAAGDIGSVTRYLQSVVRELDPERPVDNIVTLESLRTEDLAPQRLNATLFSAFAALALIIAAVGVLGVLAFSVSQRGQEFGVRMALGARPGQVLRMVLGEGGAMLIIALVVGVAGSLLLSRFLQGILFQVGTADPLTYALVALMLSMVALTAAYLPARRATRVDPADALRAE